MALSTLWFSSPLLTISADVFFLTDHLVAVAAADDGDINVSGLYGFPRWFVGAV